MTKEYFYGHSVPHEEDDTGKRFYQFRVGALLAILLVILAGCATAKPKLAVEEMRVCYVELIGKTETGLFVEAQVCMTPEAYAETQK